MADPCEDAATGAEVKAALAQIAAGIDPCTESAELTDLVREFRRCAKFGYRVCKDPHSERNFIEPGERTKGIPTTITWNPELQTELERGCGGQSNRPVLRDPIASLLHEVVHAVQDCHGLNPADHEFEAVRIENIYRRASGLCQRTRYGDEPLPAAMIIACEPGNCFCTPASTPLETAANFAATSSMSEAAGDLASPAGR
jgi:hypothetical protein